MHYYAAPVTGFQCPCRSGTQCTALLTAPSAVPYGEGVLGGCFRGTFMLIVQLYVMLLKNQAHLDMRAEQASLATPVRALSAALASRQVFQQ